MIFGCVRKWEIYPEIMSVVGNMSPWLKKTASRRFQVPGENRLYHLIDMSQSTPTQGMGLVENRLYPVKNY